MDIVIFFAVILLPGYLLARYLYSGAKRRKKVADPPLDGEAPYKKIDAFLLLPLSFTFGLALLLISAMPSYLLRLDFSASLAIIACYSITLLLLVLKKGTLFKGIEFKKDFIFFLLLILIAGSTLMMVWITPHFDGDILFHLAQIRKLAENSPVSPAEAFFPIDKVNPAYGYNVWYFAVAIVASIAKADTVVVWSHLIFVILPISILALFSLAKVLFKDRLAALAAAAFYVFFNGFLANAWEFRFAPVPDQIARHVVLFVSLLLFLQYLNSKTRRDFFLTVIVATSLTAIHLYSWVHFLLAVGSFSVISALFLPIENLKNGLKIVSAVIITSAPYLLLKLENAAAVVLPEPSKRSLLAIFNGFYIVSPRYLQGRNFYITIIVLAYLVFRYRKVLREKIWLLFISSSALAGIFTIFNPILAPLVSKLITFTYTRRLFYLVQLELIWAAFVIFVILRAGERRKFAPHFKALFMAILLTAIVATPLKFKASAATATTDKATNDLMRYITTSLPERSVFAAGLWVSIRIPAYTNNYIVMGEPTHITSNVDKEQRLEDLADILSGQTSLEDTIKLLDKYDVSYIVINIEEKKRDVAIDTEKFVNKKQFEEIYNDGAYYKVYSYKGT